MGAGRLGGNSPRAGQCLPPSSAHSLARISTLGMAKLKRRGPDQQMNGKRFLPDHSWKGNNGYTMPAGSESVPERLPALTIVLENKGCRPHFTEVQTEALKSKVACPRSRDSFIVGGS